MALTDEGSGMVMPVAPAYGGGYGGGFGGFGGDWAWIIILLLAFNGGFGGGFGGFDGLYPWLNNSQNINDGFRDQFLNDNVSGIRSDLGDISTQLCNGFNGTQMSILQSVNGMQSQLASCCCENRLATQDLKYTVATENCADRAALSDGIRDILAATQAQTQSILDRMCQDKIDAKNELIVSLNNKINALESNNYIQNALTAQTQYFLGLYPPPVTA